MSGPGQRNRRDKVWVSHNRVLIGGNKKNVRNPNFDAEETKLLITLWGNPAIQKTLITSHKKFPIITKLSEAMRAYGYQRTPEEINTRLKNLKCLYNRLKKDIECGLRSHATWKHFSAMDAILTRPIFGYQNSSDALDEDEDPGQLVIKDEGDLNLEEDDDELRPEDLLQLETSTAMEANPGHDDFEVEIKEEPIDVDEYDKRLESSKAAEGESRQLNIEKLPKLIPRSSWLNNASTNTTTTTSTTAKEQNAPPPLQNSQKITRQNSVICVSAPRSLATVTSTTSLNTAIAPVSGAAAVVSGTTITSQSKAKISLVPTNLLLNQQQNQQSANLSQKNYFVSKGVANQSQTNDQNKSKMPMKVLLVNTMPNHAQLPTGNHSNTQNTKAEIIPLPMEKTQQPQLNGPLNSSTIVNKIPHIPPTATRVNVTPTAAMPRRLLKRRVSQPQTLAIPGIKSLLTNLIRGQREANLLARKRLKLDSQKFLYEKQVMQGVLNILPILKDIGTQFLQSKEPPEEEEATKPAGAQQPSSTLQCNGHETAAEDDLEETEDERTMAEPGAEVEIADDEEEDEEEEGDEGEEGEEVVSDT